MSSQDGCGTCGMAGGKGKFCPGSGPCWVPASIGAGGGRGGCSTVRAGRSLACAVLSRALGDMPDLAGGLVGGGSGSWSLRGTAGTALSGELLVHGAVSERELLGCSRGVDASKLPGDGRVRRGMSSMFRRTVCWVGIVPVLTSPFACLWAFWVSSQLRAAPGSD